MLKIPPYFPVPMAGLPRRWLVPLALAALVFAGGVSAAPAPSLPGAAAAPQIGNGSAVDIAPRLHRQLLAGDKRDFTIEFREKADLSAAYTMPWVERGRFVHERLRETAERSQAGVRAMLAQRGLRFHPYWIKNAIIVEDGDVSALSATAAFQGVARIGEVPRLGLIEPEPREDAPAARADDPTLAPNLVWVGADRAWADGATGDGVTVGIIDDGASATHDALRSQYRGALPNGTFDHDYNWYSPIGHDAEPRSNAGHGVHVIGTILGDNNAVDPAQRRRTGMAPGAKWIACMGLPMDGAEFALPACGQFMLAPTTTQGDAPDPDRRPQVVNNSWGNYLQCDGSADDFYRDIVDAWIAAGIFPVFAAGNSSGCGLPEPGGLSTVTSPASLASAFAVGSTGNHDGLYAPHSLWGPSRETSPGLPTYPDPRGYPTLKPQVVAPGVDIFSAMGDGADYGTMTGTSMSSPHIAGLVALMIEAGECLAGDYATLGTMIMQTARPIDYASGGTPPPGPGNLPNYATGWGEIDVPAAVTAAAAACGDQGFIRGAITDARGAPMSGATVEIFADEGVRIYETTSAADGSYVRRLPVIAAPGYTVRVSRYGSLTHSESGLLVQANATTRHDVQLADAAVYKISGRVTDAATGWPLHAYVAVGGRPEASVWTDPLTGQYSLRLAEGRPYRFDVSSDVPGYTLQSRDIPEVGGGSAQDFALAADLVACTAPGYGFASTLLGEDFDEGSPPAGWTSTSAGIGWQFGESADLWSRSFRIPEHGRVATANDELGPGGGLENDARNDNLVLPVQNLAGVANPALHYSSFFVDNYADTRVEASVDGGTTWTLIDRPTPTEFAAGWTRERISLAGVATGNVRLRFHSNDGTTDDEQQLGLGWAIDDVAVVGGCASPAGGGLVVGHVRDANTGAALNGAIVSVAGGGSVISGSSEDASVGDGFFALHAPAGAPLLSASRGSLPDGYGDTSASPTVIDGATVVSELALPAGRLRLHPNGPSTYAELGTTATVPLTVTNTGTLPLKFGIERAVVEEHFESLSFPPDGWTVLNTGDGCGWTGLDPSEFPNFAGGHGRAAYVDTMPCWDIADTDTVLISPPLDLSTSPTASMGFFLALLDGADAYPQLDVDASADGGVTWSTVFTESYRNTRAGESKLIELDLSAFVGTSDVRVRFHYTATPPWGAVVIDQIHLFDAATMSPLIDLSADHGELAVGETRSLDATFDAGAVNQPGTYELPLHVVENTPYAWPFGNVVATMTVTPPASFGSLRGHVRSLGTCDASPSPLAGIPVNIVAANGDIVSTTTDEDGAYTWWANAADGPFTVSAAADGHNAAAEEFVLSAGAHTVADLGLRPLRPCLLTDPPALTANVPTGGNLQQPFSLLNIGAGDGDWTLRPGGDPDVLSPVPLVQNASPTPEPDHGFGCYQAGSNFTTRNHWLRVFPPAPGTASPRERLVTALNFGVSSALALDGSQPVTVRVHRLEGDLAHGNLELLGEHTLEVPDMALDRIRVVFDEPLRTTADSVLVAEIEVASGFADGNIFFPGGNGAGESAPTYWSSLDCDAPEPVPISALGFGWVHLVLELETLASDACGATTAPVSWLAVSQSAGHLAGDGGVALQASFDATGLSHDTYHGSICVTPGPSGGTATTPVTLSVSPGGDTIFVDGFE